MLILDNTMSKHLENLIEEFGKSIVERINNEIERQSDKFLLMLIVNNIAIGTILFLSR